MQSALFNGGAEGPAQTPTARGGIHSPVTCADTSATSTREETTSQPCGRVAAQNVEEEERHESGGGSPSHSRRHGLEDEDAQEDERHERGSERPPHSQPCGPDDVDVVHCDTSPAGADVFNRGVAQIFSTLQPEMSDRTAILSQHYFSLVCPIMSCFDTAQNPFRSLAEEGVSLSPFMFHCVMTMSAAHLFQQNKHIDDVSLEHRTEAMSCLTTELNLSGSEIKMEMLFGTIMLGMTSVRTSLDIIFATMHRLINCALTQAWIDPSSLGINHLHGARTLFKAWIAGLAERCVESSSVSENQNLLIGLMAYWEALASFVADQSPNEINYLLEFCQQQHQDGQQIVFPNPFTGFCTPLFLCLAQVGVLSRQKCHFRHLLSRYDSTAGCGRRNELSDRMVEEARQIIDAVRRWAFPSDDQIHDPNDCSTPLSHFRSLARVYRLTTLLEVYLAFPEILDGEIGTASTTTSHSIITALAISILNVISSIPESSGVNASLNLALLIAGSALQRSPPAESNRESNQIPIEHEILESMGDSCTVLQWRSYVRDRMEKLYRRVGLLPVQRAANILELVWMRADMTIPRFLDSGSSYRMVHWADVMIEERLETIIG